MKVQAQFPKACRAEEAVSAPVQPPAGPQSGATAHATAHADAHANLHAAESHGGEPSTTDASMRTTVHTSSDDYVSTVPNLPHLSEGAQRASRT